MKTLFILFSICCLTTLKSQTRNLQLIYQFDSAGLIYPWEKSNFIKEERQREKWKKKNKDDIYYEDEIEFQKHYPLAVLLQLKMFSTSGTRSLMHFTPAPITIPKEKEQHWKDSLAFFLHKLTVNNLISQKTETKLKPLVTNLTVKTEYELVERACQLTEIEYFLLPEKLTKFLNDLLERDLLNTESYKSIVEKSNRKDLVDYTDILKEIKGIVFISKDEYLELNQKEVFEKGYKKSASVLDILNYDSLSYSIEKDNAESDTGFIVYDALVSIYKEGNIYRYKSFFDADFSNKSKEYVQFLPDQYHQIFNKILADQHSEYRLHIVSISRNQFALLPLKKSQFEGLMWSYSGMSSGYIELSYENFSSGFTQTKIKETIAAYDSIGLFRHLSKTEIQKGLLKVEFLEINNYSDILAAFKNIVFAIDLEYGIDKEMYKKITEQLAAHSKGYFVPTDILDKYIWKKNNKKPFEYGFVLNNKVYKTQLVQEDDWLDLKFYELIENALKEQQAPGRFFEVHPCDGLCVVFLTNEQYQFLKAKQLLEFSDEDVKRN